MTNLARNAMCDMATNKRMRADHHNTKQCGLLNLTVDLIIESADYLDYSSLGRFANTCSFARSLATLKISGPAVQASPALQRRTTLCSNTSLTAGTLLRIIARSRRAFQYINIQIPPTAKWAVGYALRDTQFKIDLRRLRICRLGRRTSTSVDRTAGIAILLKSQ